MLNRKSALIDSGLFNSKLRSIVIGLLLVAFATTAAAAKDQFKLRGEKMEGTKIRSVDAVSPIPFNKSYDQLTDKQREIFRSSYGVLADDEKPPFPVKGTQVIYKPIIKGHKEIARAGKLFIVAMVDEKGKVENVAVYDSPAESMTQYATTVMFSIDFEPATCAGTPCKMEFPFEFDLKQQERQPQYRK